MTRTLRALFLARSLRVKLLLAAVVVAVAAIWLSSLAGRAGRFARAARVTSGVLKEQAFWLTNRGVIEASAQASAGRLDAVRTLDGTRLLAEVSAIADESGLKNYTSGEPKDESSGQFSIHTLQFNVTKVDWPALKEFYLALSKRSPYIGIVEFSLQGDRTNPALLNVSLHISSVEISRSP
jgi:hypothetical protein